MTALTRSPLPSRRHCGTDRAVPPEDFCQLIFEFPRARFRHTPSFVGMHYSDDLIILDVTFIEGRRPETRLALLKDINARVAAEAKISPDDLMITIYEAPGVNFSLGQGEAQRANSQSPDPDRTLKGLRLRNHCPRQKKSI